MGWHLHTNIIREVQSQRLTEPRSAKIPMTVFPPGDIQTFGWITWMWKVHAYLFDFAQQKGREVMYAEELIP